MKEIRKNWVKKLFMSFICFAILLSTFAIHGKPTFAAANWLQVGTITSEYAGAVSFTLDSNGVPYIAYVEGKSVGGKFTFNPVVKKYNGSGWEVVGTIGSLDGLSIYMSVAVGIDGVPYVAVQNALNEIIVMKYDNDTWSQVGSGKISGGQDLSLAINKEGTPFIAYPDVSNKNKLSVMEFTGDGQTGWEYVGSPGFSSEAIYSYDYPPSSSVTLVFDHNDVPYVAYLEGIMSNSIKTNVKKFTGSTESGWDSVGETITGKFENISLDFDPNDVPI